MSDPLNMTLRDFIALAERVGAAAQTIREVQATMGGAPIRYPDDRPTHVIATQLEAEMRRDHRPTVANKPVDWSPQELAQREKMRVERETALLREMPDDVKAAVGS